MVRRQAGVKPLAALGAKPFGLTPAFTAADRMPRRGKARPAGRVIAPGGAGPLGKWAGSAATATEPDMSTTSTQPTTTTTAPDDLAPRTLAVVAYPDPVVENSAGSIPTASDDALIWWTPSVGPTAMLMAHRFATYAAEGPSSWSLVDLAQTFGAGNSTGRMLHTLDRLERFGIIVRRGDIIGIRLWLPPLTSRQRARLPEYLAYVYPHA